MAKRARCAHGVLFLHNAKTHSLVRECLHPGARCAPIISNHIGLVPGEEHDVPQSMTNGIFDKERHERPSAYWQHGFGDVPGEPAETRPAPADQKNSLSQHLPTPPAERLPPTYPWYVRREFATCMHPGRSPACVKLERLRFGRMRVTKTAGPSEPDVQIPG